MSGAHIVQGKSHTIVFLRSIKRFHSDSLQQDKGRDAEGRPVESIPNPPHRGQFDIMYDALDSAWYVDLRNRKRPGFDGTIGICSDEFLLKKGMGGMERKGKKEQEGGLRVRGWMTCWV